MRPMGKQERDYNRYALGVGGERGSKKEKPRGGGGEGGRTPCRLPWKPRCTPAYCREKTAPLFQGKKPKRVKQSEKEEGQAGWREEPT